MVYSSIEINHLHPSLNPHKIRETENVPNPFMDPEGSTLHLEMNVFLKKLEEEEYCMKKLGVELKDFLMKVKVDLDYKVPKYPNHLVCFNHIARHLNDCLRLQ